jgi:hypothetical protein
MWDNIQEGEINVTWISTVLTHSSSIGVTDGLYDREPARTVSGSGWVICCIKSRQLLRGSFFKILPKAGSYRGELLGLVALHTLIVVVAQFFELDAVTGKICCGNISALGQFSKTQKQVSTGIKHLDLHRSIRTMKYMVQMNTTYLHVRADQDRILPWSMLTLEQQLNVICNDLANGAAARYLSNGRDKNSGSSSHSKRPPLCLTESN